MIPQIIHQTGPDNWRSNAIWNAYQPSWQSLHPTWHYKFWTDQANEDFVKCKFPEYYDLYCKLPYMINRVDMVRYLYMYEFGGWYVDLDCQCLKSFDDLALPFVRENGQKDMVILGQHTIMGRRVLECAVIGSSPKHWIWRRVIQHIAVSLEKYGSCCCCVRSWRIINTTGPFMLTRCIEECNELNPGVCVVGEDYFYPQHHRHNSITYCTHYSVRSWVDGDLERCMADLHQRKPYGPFLIWAVILFGLFLSSVFGVKILSYF